MGIKGWGGREWESYRGMRARGRRQEAGTDMERHVTRDTWWDMQAAGVAGTGGLLPLFLLSPPQQWMGQI